MFEPIRHMEVRNVSNVGAIKFCIQHLTTLKLNKCELQTIQYLGEVRQY